MNAQLPRKVYPKGRWRAHVALMEHETSITTFTYQCAKTYPVALVMLEMTAVVSLLATDKATSEINGAELS